MAWYSSLVFSQFLRNVASCFNDRARVRSVDFNLAFVGLLLGGSVGTVFCVHRIASKTELLPWLAGGWLLCFAWHLWLVKSVRRCVDDGLGADPGPRVLPRPKGLSGVRVVRTLSGLRRLAQKKPDR